ncbi:MAG: DUF937 domain-containing protein [Tissierellia bacterium]|nr:DUF937 domain-containing protein [Tissierellia bacterium]
MENIIGMVRTFAPLTSAPTITKVNTYLPAVEKVSTLLGMYSFLNRAQNFRPIQTLDAKTPVDKITALLKNGNIPVTKLMAQPFLANNMDKIVGALAMNMAKNGGLNDILSSLTSGNKSGLNDMLSSLTNGNTKGLNDGNKDGNTDIGSLMETFMPMLNSIMSTSEESKETNEYNEFLEHSDETFKNADFDHNNAPPSTEKNIKHEKHVQRPIRIRQRRR